LGDSLRLVIPPLRQSVISGILLTLVVALELLFVASISVAFGVISLPAYIVWLGLSLPILVILVAILRATLLLAYQAYTLSAAYKLVDHLHSIVLQHTEQSIYSEGRGFTRERQLFLLQQGNVNIAEQILLPVFRLPVDIIILLIMFIGFLVKLDNLTNVLYLLGVLSFIVLVAFWYKISIRSCSNELKYKEASLISYIQWGVADLFRRVVSGTYKRFCISLKNLSEERLKTLRRLAILQSTPKLTFDIFTGLTIGAAVAYGDSTQQGVLSPEYVLPLIFLYRATPYLNSLIASIGQIQSGKALLSEVTDLLAEGDGVREILSNRCQMVFPAMDNSGSLIIMPGTYRVADKLSIVLSNTIKLSENCINIFQGPSGSGKTTLLTSCILNMHRYWGEAFSYYYISQLNDSVLTEFSGIRYGIFCEFAKELNLSPVTINEVTNAVSTNLITPFKTLSTGEAFRAELARVACSAVEVKDGRAVIFLDEPFSALDSETTEVVTRFIARQFLKKNWIVILSSHIEVGWPTNTNINKIQNSQNEIYKLVFNK
jgi:ABC-type lipoprotein export system ATPase subunit